MWTLDWIQQFPLLALVFVFLVAFSESLVLVGMVVPGAILMVSFGALIATHILPFWPTLLAAFLGAVVGDGVSYTLGRHFKYRLAQLWPLSRYPNLIPKGEIFFTRHGAKSVLLGRFFGPLRAVIPAIAGMMKMPPRQFYMVNIISAALWAPVYLLPGMAFAVSLELASEMTARIALFLLLFLLTFVLLAWLIKHLYQFSAPRLHNNTIKLMLWMEHHPRLSKLPGTILNPQQSDVLALSVFGIVLFIGIIATSLLLQGLSHWPVIYNLDQVFTELLQALHHPLLNKLMLLFSILGNFYFLIALFSIFILWKIFGPPRDDTRLVVIHCIVVLLLPLLLIAFIQFSPSFENLTQAFLPDGKLMLAIGFYGFVSIYLVKFITPVRKWIIYFCSSSCVALIALTHLYFGWNGIISVAIGLITGIIWVALSGLAMRRHLSNAQPLTRAHWLWLFSAYLPLIFVAPVVYTQQLNNLPSQSQTRYTITFTNWQNTGWNVLPQLRHDLWGYNQYSFNLQWNSSASSIAEVMQFAGWQKPENKNIQLVHWLNPQPSLKQLYVLPHVHDGIYEQLLWVKPQDEENLSVVRLWKSNIIVENPRNHEPLWFGSISILNKTKHWGLTYLRTRKDVDPPIQTLTEVLSGCEISQKKSAHDVTSLSDKAVLLISNCRIN